MEQKKNNNGVISRRGQAEVVGLWAAGAGFVSILSEGMMFGMGFYCLHYIISNGGVTLPMMVQ